MNNQNISDDIIINITEAEHIPPYKIRLWFNDGAERTVNFGPFLKKSRHLEIRKYLKPDMFKDFSIAHGRLDWNDYDLCFSMHDLYKGTV